MIGGIFHEGSGLGDQLFRYITVRTLAEEKGYRWGFYNPDQFKGTFFTEVNLGVDPMIGASSQSELTVFKEKDVRDETGVDIRSYDPEINFVEDNTFIDGSFEDSKYWGHNLANISKWLAVEPLYTPDYICVLGFRGGEYAANPDLFLSKEYYNLAINRMCEKGVREFIIHTDDTDMASKFFDYKFPVVANPPISHSNHINMGLNWRSARYAKYAIIPNSAFFILPRLLKHLEDPTAVTIAPRYWARHNTKVWARPACYYKKFTYI